MWFVFEAGVAGTELLEPTLYCAFVDTSLAPYFVDISSGLSGVNSDKCFLELPNFVLEGTALAIETEISHQECKCRCLVGESRYGEACQSFQYYFDSNTCLIYKQNRSLVSVNSLLCFALFDLQTCPQGAPVEEIHIAKPTVDSNFTSPQKETINDVT
ncbi:unnamed protein product [Haemonchus placei]|uniref:Apple domain-containing protein n=1 Tax=Haemonchus placei TaxID=6290 RepID=A0A0N4WKR9_HAEPC|nr:unnamed protein product [Haemonchus placei]